MTYTIQRDGIKFNVNTSTHDGENNLGFCPKGFNDWGALESQSNIQIKPFIHGVEIDWDGAELNLPDNIKNELSFISTINDVQNNEGDAYGYSYDETEIIEDGTVKINSTGQLLNVINTIANLLPQQTEGAINQITPSIITYPKPQSTSHEFIVRSNVQGQVQVDILSQGDNENIVPSVANVNGVETRKFSLNTNTLEATYKLLPVAGVQADVPTVSISASAPNKNKCTITVSSTGGGTAHIYTNGGSFNASSNQTDASGSISAGGSKSFTLINRGDTSIAPTVYATVTVNGTSYPSTPYTIIVSQTYNNVKGYTSYNGTMAGGAGGNATGTSNELALGTITPLLYYYYIGWVEPTFNNDYTEITNLDTLLNKTYPNQYVDVVEVGDNETEPAEGFERVSVASRSSYTPISRFEKVKDNIVINCKSELDGQPMVESYWYCIMPANQALYSFANEATQVMSHFDLDNVRTVTISNVEHKVYRSLNTQNTLGGFLIK